MNGYKDLEDTPEYRCIFGEISSWNQYHGWQPVVFYDNDMSNKFSYQSITDSVPKLQSLIFSNCGTIEKPFYGRANELLSELTGLETKFAFISGINSLDDILGKVKNCILDWTITLERNGVLGEGFSFTNEEKSIAKKI